jgi:outer membrane receptor for ferrienterochelin and colicin
LEAIVQSTPNDQLELSPAFEKGHYTDDYLSAGVPNLTDGKTPTHMPEWTLGATYSHRFDLPGNHVLTAMADVHYQGQQINTFNPDAYNDAPDKNEYITSAYSIGDFWLTFGPRDDRYRIGAYVRNVANTEYKYDIFPGTSGPTAYVNNPRTYGATITVKF